MVLIHFEEVNFSHGKDMRMRCVLYMLILMVMQLGIRGLAQEQQQEWPPDEVRRGIPMRGMGGRSRAQIYYERLAAKLEPSGKGDLARAQHYVDVFKAVTIPDPHLFHFDVHATTQSLPLRLTGSVEFTEHKAPLLRVLQQLGFEDVKGEIEVLPSQRLGDKKFGLVKVTAEFGRARANERSEPLTQCLLGDPLYLLDERPNGYYLCHTATGYIAYVPKTAVLAVDRDAFSAYTNGARAIFQKQFSEGGLTIPLGAKLKLVSRKGATCVVRLPEGKELPIKADYVKVRGDKPSAFVEDIFKTARTFLGSPYRWSGQTLEGSDCSGFINTVFRAHGINLPRDAYQQLVCGELTGTRWYRDSIQPGDTLYFISGRSGGITHTGLYLGKGKFINASRPGVVIESLKPGDENYNEGRDRGLAFAKRLVEFTE